MLENEEQIFIQNNDQVEQGEKKEIVKLTADQLVKILSFDLKP
jgi:hypothetical protein